MSLEKRKPTGREKDQEAIELLEQLREKLYSDNISTARRSAFQLSWMQEDGYEILAEALLKYTPRHTKSAACYGLRNMHGRMKKVSRELIEKCAESDNKTLRDVCKGAIDILEGRFVPKKPQRNRGKSRYQIRDVSSKGKKRRPISHTSPRERGSRGNDRRNFNR